MQMENKALEEKRAYFREYYRNNKEKRKLYTKRYWEKKAQEAQANTSNNIVKETKDKALETKKTSHSENHKKNKDKKSENELRIRSKEFTGDLQPRSYKLYENVREALKDFTEQHKEYKAQDIVNKAIMEFISKYGN